MFCLAAIAGYLCLMAKPMSATKAAPPTRKRGRPKSQNPKNHDLRIRMEGQLFDALTSYQKRHKLDDLSEATRHALSEILRREGLLK